MLDSVYFIFQILFNISYASPLPRIPEIKIIARSDQRFFQVGNQEVLLPKIHPSSKLVSILHQTVNEDFNSFLLEVIDGPFNTPTHHTSRNLYALTTDRQYNHLQFQQLITVSQSTTHLKYNFDYVFKDLNGDKIPEIKVFNATTTEVFYFQMSPPHWVRVP